MLRRTSYTTYTQKEGAWTQYLHNSNLSDRVINHQSVVGKKLRSTASDATVTMRDLDSLDCRALLVAH